MERDNNNRSVNRETIPNSPVGTGGGQPYLQNWLGPYNEGQLPEANGIGKITGPCGDTMMIYLRIGKEGIDEVRFQVDGCAFSRTCASIAASLAKGKSWRRPGILTNTKYSAVFRPSRQKKNIVRCWPETPYGGPMKISFSPLLRVRGVPGSGED